MHPHSMSSHMSNPPCLKVFPRVFPSANTLFSFLKHVLLINHHVMVLKVVNLLSWWCSVLRLIFSQTLFLTDLGDHMEC